MASKLLLSASSIATWQTCKRRYYYEKLMNLRPVEAADALAFGSAMHAGLEQIFRRMMEAKHAGEMYSREFHLATVEDACLSALSVDLPESERIKVEVLLGKYAERWLEEDMRDRTVVGVEEHREIPVRGPSGRRTSGIAVQGYCDALAMDGSMLSVVEHKTTSIVNDDYFDHAGIDLQVYLYADIFSHAGGRDGMPVRQVIYDAIQKPRQEMAVGETDEEFEARKAASKCPARCKRKEAESPEEFRSRLEAAIDESYFRREYINIDDALMREMREELWNVAHEIKSCKCYAKSTCNCMKWGKCPFMDVCRNGGAFDGLEDRFTKREVRNATKQES